nr:ATP-binding protein [Sporosarcina beigongshangi]
MHLYEHSSIILTSNKSPDQRAELMGDEGITTAIFNRLLHRVEVVKIDEYSHRMKQRTVFIST